MTVCYSVHGSDLEIHECPSGRTVATIHGAAHADERTERSRVIAWSDAHGASLQTERRGYWPPCGSVSK